MSGPVQAGTLPPPPPAAEGTGGIALDAQEQEALGEELARLSPLFAAPERRAALTALTEAVASGAIPEGLEATAALALELALGSGSAAHYQGPPAEQTLAGLFGRTAAGRELARGLEGANRALGALAGQQLVALRLTSRLPGRFRLEVATDRCELSLDLDRLGPRAREVEIHG